MSCELEYLVIKSVKINKVVSRYKTINSKISYYPVLTLFLLVAMLLFILGGCQDELVKITLPPSDQVVLPNSPLADIVKKVTLNDGSSDNILDNSSCTLLVLPVRVLVNGQELKIDSADDFRLVERIFDETENDDDTLIILFPVTIILADHTTVVINEQDALEDIIDKCSEGGLDEDIECIDFKYPITLSLYDSNNQVPKALTVDNDEELFELFDDLDNGQFISFKFPTTVVLWNKSEVAVNDNNELEDIIESSIGDCDEDDDNDYNDDDTDDTALIAVFTSGQWEITYFFDQADKTAAFENFVFTFAIDRTALATKYTSSINGTWESYGDSSVIELEFDFGEEPPLNNLLAYWQLVEFTTSTIKLNRQDEEDLYADVVVFQKK